MKTATTSSKKNTRQPAPCPPNECDALTQRIATGLVMNQHLPVTEQIARALAEIGSFHRADRALLELFSESGAGAGAESGTGTTGKSPIHQWLADNTAATSTAQNAAAAPALAHLRAHLASGKVLHAASLEELPAQAADEKAFFASCSIRSLIRVPLIFKGENNGMLGLDMIREQKNWSEEEITRLLDIAGLLAHHLGYQKQSRRDETKNIDKALQGRIIHGQLQILYEASPDLIFLFDDQCALIDANSKAFKALGCERDQPLEPMLDCFTDPNLPPSDFLEKIQSALQAIPVEFESFFQNKQGDNFPVEIRLKKIELANAGERAQPYVIAMVRNISDRKKLEEERVRTQKLESAGILAKGIAHDFNNILTALLGGITTAKICESPEKRRRLLDNAEAAAMHGHKLTRQLFSFAKSSPTIKQTALVEDLIKKSISFIQHGPETEINCNLPGDLNGISVDPDQITQVFHNIILNATQSMPDGGVIDIRAENSVLKPNNPWSLPEGDYIRIEIEDRGHGIPPEHINKIFDPYFTTKSEGTGLGMAVCFSIIKKHAGGIDITSKPGEGTTFIIHLPSTGKKVHRRKKTKQPAPMQTGNGRVLFMDDETPVRNVARAMLSSLGYHVDCAVDGIEAVKFHAEARKAGTPYDAVIMDLTVPNGMGGEEAIKRMREIDPDIKAIVSSGFSDNPVMLDFKAHGFCGALKKPYRITDLNIALAELLKKGRATSTDSKLF